MKRVLLVLAIAAIAHADTQSQLDALTSIDAVPTKGQLQNVFGTPDLPPDLVSFAQNQSTGVRLRAIHALIQYCTAPCADNDPAHAPLTQILTDNATALAGPDLLVLRAAIESLGPMQDPADAALLMPFLNHPSRDIRATTALALGELCNTSTNVVSALRTRLQNEAIDQVRLAISTALRVLNQAPCSP